jgi:hypothetical protein
MNSTEILEQLRLTGGATLDRTLNPVTDIKFVSSCYGHELKIALQALDTFDLDLTLKHYKKLAKNLGAYIGLWIHQGFLYLDISKNFDTKEECLTFARGNRQIAIFDATTKQAIEV